MSMGNFVDMSGWKMWEHGVPDSRIIVLKRAKDKRYENGRRVVKWECRCSCGSNKVILSTTRDLTSGHTKSCGCLHSEKTREAHIIHGGADSRLYHIWCGIKARCLNPNNAKYKNYGGRGITVCEEWSSNYKIFESWALSSGYNDSLTIDRIDNSQGYHPLNCRWVSYNEQNRNKSNNIYLVIDGISKILKDWSIHINIPYKTLMSFYYRHSKDDTIQYINDRIKQLNTREIVITIV